MAGCVWVGKEPPESSDLYRSLVCDMQSGVAYCRMLFEGGKPMDFAYLMVNRAFTTHIGFDDVVGKKVTEVIPGLKPGDPEVFERYARVALTGRPDAFEIYSEPLKKWFQVSLYGHEPEHFVAVLDNVTERKKAEERERRLTSTYRALSDTNEAILKFKSTDELYPQICRIAVEHGGMIHAWIGVPNAEGRFVSVGRCGRFMDPNDPSRLADPSFEITVMATPDCPEGRGPSGIAFREGRSVAVNDILADERLAPWHELARRDGTRSMAAIPIIKGDSPFGVFSVYSDQPDVFDEENVALLESMADNLGFALANLERETLLRESETRFRTLFENARDGIFIGDMAGRLVDVNASGAQMLGYLPDEVRTLKVSDILAGHERSRVPENWDGWEVGSNAVSEWVFLRKDGSTFEGEVNSQVLPDGRFMGILRDVTERRRMLAALEEKEQILRLFIESAPAAIAMLDREMRYLALSRRFIEDYRLTEGNLIGRSHYDVFPEVPERWREFHRRCLAGETIRMDEDSFVREDGRLEWIRWEIKPWYSEGIVGGMLIFSEVITDRKKAEQEKVKLSEQLQLALDAANLGWWCYDPVAEVISFDQRNQKILGLPNRLQTREEVLMRIHPDDRTAVWKKVAAALNPADPRPYEAEYRYLMPDGSVRWLKAYGMATFQGEGKARQASSLVGTVADISGQKQAEEEKARLSEQRQLALDSANLGWWHYDVAADKVAYDERYGKICEFSGDKLGIEAILARTHPDDRNDLLEKIRAALNPSDPRPYEIEVRLVLDDGSVRWIQSHGIATFEGKGAGRRATSMVGTVADITSSKNAEEALRLAAAVYRDSSEAMMVLDENRNIIMVNQAFAEITGYESSDVTGRHPRFLRIDDLGDALYREEDVFYQDMWRQADETGRFKGEIWHRKKNGQFFAVQLTVNVITGDTGLPRRYVVLLSDITEKKRSDDLIWSQANFDTLTGLPNRRFFRDRLEHEVRNARRSNLPLALLFIDLDGFKDVNDTLGHDMGDILLKEAAERLYRCVRESDTVARLGGDEFTVILTEMHDPSNADRVARHILEALSEPVTLGEEQAYVSASIGITLYPNDGAQVEDLIRNADQAMYEAKQRGKNQYQYFTPAMQKAAIKRMRLVNDMRKALERNQFEILYQPIVELSTGFIRKAEALIRWRHPRRGLVNPVEFISAAEDTGMISAFGNWIFHEAAKRAALWREKYHPEFQISVNISPVQFKKEGIDPIVWLDHLKGLGVPGQGIVVEITEGLLMDVDLKVTDQLLMLRDAGIEVALDDFGTGYSSLAYLKRFDIDYLKIDQTFIHHLRPDSDDMALCEAMIVMAHKLGLEVIAEGIETNAQRSLLISAGCDFAQGYLFSKPVSADEFERLMEADPY